MSFSKKRILYLFAILWLFSGLIVLHYFIENREQVALLIACYLSAFIPYTVLAFKAKLNPFVILLTGVLLRASLLFGPPTLSDDSYRYYWDGQLLANGVNPYSIKPSKKLDRAYFDSKKNDGISIYQKLNSKAYYSVYPPVSQVFFAISAKIGGSHNGFILAFRIMIILAEILTALLIIKLLSLKKMNTSFLAIYFLNPLIIMELSGNLHGEVFMVLFIALSLVFLRTNKVALSGVVLAIAFATKLYPLIFTPLFILELSKTNRVKFLIAFALTAAIAFAPLIGINELININESISLYYEKFEFNGGIYSLLKTLGVKLTGYNQIAVIGKFLMFVFIFSCIYIYNLKLKLKERFSVEASILCLMLCFYILSTTVMPWYLTLIVFTSVFVNQKAGVFWSALIVLTYSAFANNLFNENPLLVFIEYLFLSIVLIYEFLKLKKLNFFEPYK